MSSLRRFRYDDADDEILNQGLACNFLQALDSLWFRLRRRNPICFITALRFQISIPDDDEVQVLQRKTTILQLTLKFKSS